MPSIKNIVREICLSLCEGKYPNRDNAKVALSQIPKGTFASAVEAI